MIVLIFKACRDVFTEKIFYASTCSWNKSPIVRSTKLTLAISKRVKSPGLSKNRKEICCLPSEFTNNIDALLFDGVIVTKLSFPQVGVICFNSKPCFVVITEKNTTRKIILILILRMLVVIRKIAKVSVT
jgi:hypothetical protein